MKLAIMQPYFFPYIGYFQLVNAVDKFIFYDDVNYIKGGWINRNYIIVNGNKKYITLNLRDASSFRRINQIYVGDRNDKVLKTIKLSYSKAPYFNQTFPLVEDVFSSITSSSLISEIAAMSIIKVSNYLGLKTDFEFSSKHYDDCKELDREKRLINICKRNNTDTYINAIGGKDLYEQNLFQANKMDLLFLKSNLTKYEQFSKIFEPGLSIIDVMMFNSKQDLLTILGSYELA